MIMDLKTSIQNVWIFKSDDEAKLARDHIQKAVDEWIGTNCDKPFAVRDLFGGESAWDWQDMPLEPLWKNYREKGKTPDEAFDLAAKAAGKLLKKVLHEDKRKFRMHDGYVNSYSLVAEE
jgi:hypothetical protein